jgi:hypothetical protein
MLSTICLFLFLELLDEAEFGEEARNLEYDETTINPASDLGLLVGVRIYIFLALKFYQFSFL